MSSSRDAWDYRQSVNRGADARSLVGYHVHATDGDIGKIDEASDDAAAALRRGLPHVAVAVPPPV